MSKKPSPWNELDFYKEGQPIYGRDEDIRKISLSICQNLQTTLYGQSGIGKSSLLNAGIFPVLRKEAYFPVFIRLGVVNKDDAYIDYIIKCVSDEAEKIDDAICKYKIHLNSIYKIAPTADTANNEADRLWEFFIGTEFLDNENNSFIPVLVFDQFEEILNNRDTYQKAKQLLLDLYTLIDDTRIHPEGSVAYSNFRIIFSLREDYLYCFEDIIDKFDLTELRFNRFRIKALTHLQAREVILKTSAGDIEKGKEQDICNKIIEESQNYMGEVNTLMLSLICSTNYSNSPDGILRLSALDNCEDQLYYYYEDKMSAVRVITKRYLEKVLVTNDGRRDSIDTKAAIDSGIIIDGEINALVNNRIVRVLSTSEGGKRMEFIHDKITSIINSKKQTYLQCFKNALANMFNLNSRANAKEYRASLYCFSFACLIFAGFEILWIVFDSDWLMVVAYYVLLFAIYLLTITGIRRSHDRNISGWEGIWDYNKNCYGASSPVMYSGGTAGVLASYGTHSSNALNRTEFIAFHKHTLFSSFWLILLNLPLIILLWDIVDAFWQGYIIGILLGVTFFRCLGFTIRRLPAMKITRWVAVVPIIPWIICFFERKDEQYFKIDDGKLLRNMMLGYFILVAILMAVIHFWGYPEEMFDKICNDREVISTEDSAFLNERAYECAKAGDFYGAHVYIDAAIEQYPEEAYLYDSKGEFYFMQDSIECAVEMWNEVLKRDSLFLESYPNGTALYNSLKEQGLIN